MPTKKASDNIEKQAREVPEMTISDTNLPLTSESVIGQVGYKSNGVERLFTVSLKLHPEGNGFHQFECSCSKCLDVSCAHVMSLY